MGDTVMTIIAIVVVAVLMLVYPLLNMAENNETVVQMSVQTLTSEFVNTVTTEGRITVNVYNDFIQNLHALEPGFEVEIEVQHIDENPGKATVITHSDAIGENLTFSVFTSSIVDMLEDEGVYVLSRGDFIIVNVRNTNRTIAQMLRDFFFSFTGASYRTLTASETGMVVNNGRR